MGRGCSGCCEMRNTARGLQNLMVIGAVGLMATGMGLHAENAQKGSGREAREVFDRLKQLEGIWRGEGGTPGGEASPVVHEFHVSAGGSVVLEIMDPEGEREINVYHLVGDDLLLTHYCGGGNQPTLKLERDRASNDMLRFTFSTATNLKDPSKDRHIHASKIVFLDPDRIESWWTVFKDGKETAVSRFRLARSEGP
jgi:hypothetical protein